MLKAAAFDYARAGSIEEAIGLLVRHGDDAKLLAGGQSLLPALNLRLSAQALLVDIGHIPGLRGIGVTDGVLRIGAMTTHAELAASEAVARAAPLLTRAASHIAHPAIRNRGTIGGSLANADPAAELPACVLALQARIAVQGPAGRRLIPADGFFAGLFETTMQPDEILTGVEINLAPDARWGFAELARRSGDYAIVGLAAHWTGGAPRLAYFSVGARATLARHAAAALAGGATPDAITRATAALDQDLQPDTDLQASAAMRLHLARVLLRRVVAPWGPQATEVAA